MHEQERISSQDALVFSELQPAAAPVLPSPLDLLKSTLHALNTEQLQEHVLRILDRSEDMLKELNDRLLQAATASEFLSIAESVDTNLRRLQTAVEHHRDQLPLEKSQKDLRKIHERIIEICRSDYKIEKNLDLNIFDQYDLETPNAFGDRACDALVETILDGYAHTNFGQYLADRRNASLSSWGADYIPDTVVKLVKKRFTARDGVLDAIHVLGDLKAAQESILEQAALQREKKLCRLVKEYPEVSTADLIAFVSDAKCPIQSKSLLALEANYHRVSSLTQTKEIFSSITRKLSALIESCASTGGNRRTELERAEREHVGELRSRGIQAILKSPAGYHSVLASNSYEYGNNLGSDISRFATDEQKNQFTDTLLQDPGKELLRVGAAFFMAEASLLSRAISEKGPQVLDYALASFPRLMLVAYYLKRTENQYSVSVDSYLQGVQRTHGFPLWMADWQRFFLQEMREERMISARANTLDCAAFGRFKGNHVPMSEALSLRAGNRRRGLEFSDPL